MEVWTSVPGYEGRYEVSDLGGVRRVLPDGRYRILQPYVHNEVGHLRVTLYCAAGCKKQWWVHRLVLFAFEGEPPEDAPLACHKNSDPADNALVNLYWGNESQNAFDREAYARKMRGLPPKVVDRIPF